MREWLRKLKPTSFDDLIAMNALYRPGPMDLIPNYIDRKHGREKVSYPHETSRTDSEAYLRYPRLSGAGNGNGADHGRLYSWTKRILLRRAMGKKKQEEMDRQRTIFVKGALERDVEEKTANEVFDMMAKFAGYGFNKSHSAAYSLVAFHTAYLKAHYPAEFMAAAMTNEMSDTKKLANVLDDAKRMGLEILPPSINASLAHFSVEGGGLRFGLGAVKGVGLSAIESIINYREEHGPFETIFDITEGIDLRAVNKKALDSLARAGAMDTLEGHRAQLVESVDVSVLHGQKYQAEKAAGQNSLFGEGTSDAGVMKPRLAATEPWPRSKLLKEERELVGVYVSGHPLQTYQAEATSFASASLADTEKFEGITHDYQSGRNRPTHRFCGIITDVQTRTTRSGKPMAFASIEDFSGQAELVCFSTVLDRVQQYLNVDEIVLVSGSPEVRGNSLKIVVNEIYPMWKVREMLIKSIVLRIREDEIDLEIMKEFERLCDENRGTCKLYFDIDASDLPGPQRVHSRKFVVEPTNDLMSGMARLFGRDNIVLQGDS